MYVNLLNSHTVRYRLLYDYPSEPYTDVYWIKYVDIDSARVARKRHNHKSFFGKQIHVCYASEYETVQGTREKLQQRRKVIAKKTRGIILELSSLIFDNSNFFLTTES